MTPEQLDEHSRRIAAYVHIPFCAAICPYCDFAVVAGADDQAERYVAAVVAEIRMSEPLPALESIYFGGGTPSHLEPALLGRILDALAQRHGVAVGAEISIEANPEDLDVARARAVAGLGFNRVSFGAQSFDGTVLASLGRRHDAHRIAQAVAAARDAGLGNLSLDLIFGAADETPASWEGTVSAALEIDPGHISCYALTVEPGTPLARAVREGAAGPDPDTQADRYELAESRLAAAGYDRYEVSNWSRPGRECRYNLTVWAQGEYEAYGNGAHRFRFGSRSRNVRRLEAYMGRVESGARPTAGGDQVAGWDSEIDRLFVGLRRTVGVAHGPGVDAFLATPRGVELIDAGVVGMVEGRLTVRRPLLTDEAHRLVLDLEPPEGWGKTPDGR